jgi:formate hydrogenlyase subunit 4
MKFKNDERLALYQNFIEAMLKEGYCLEYIGRELAIIAHALGESHD